MSIDLYFTNCDATSLPVKQFFQILIISTNRYKLFLQRSHEVERCDVMVQRRRPSVRPYVHPSRNVTGNKRLHPVSVIFVSLCIQTKDVWVHPNRQCPWRSVSTSNIRKVTLIAIIVHNGRNYKHHFWYSCKSTRDIRPLNLSQIKAVLDLYLQDKLTYFSFYNCFITALLKISFIFLFLGYHSKLQELYKPSNYNQIVDHLDLNFRVQTVRISMFVISPKRLNLNT